MPHDMDEYPWQGNHGSQYYSAVGYLCHQWNILEQLYVHRASDIMGIKRNKHDLIFRHLGTVAIGEFMNEYAAAHIKSVEVRDQLAYVIKFINQCRINRNAIIHGWTDVGGASHVENILVRSRADQRRPKPTEFTVSLPDIARVCEEVEMGARLIVAVSFLFGRKGMAFSRKFFGEDWRARLLKRPPLPVSVAASRQARLKPSGLRLSSRK